MARSGFDIRSLARAINRRREEYNRLHPDHPVMITPAMSRILEYDEDYIPYRPRRARQKRRSAAMNPAISTIVEIAAALETTVGDLLGEPAFRIAPADRKRLREIVAYLSGLFDL